MSRKQREPIRKIILTDGTVRWRCVVDAGFTKEGRRRQATRTFSTMKEARSFLASTRVAITTGTYVAPAEVTVANYLDGWLESRRHSIRPKTLEGYRSALARAMAAFGDERLDRLSKAHLVEMIGTMRSGKRPLAPRSVNLTLGLLRQALNAAVREGILIRNPAAMVNLLPEPTAEMKSWTSEEAAAFLSVTSGHLWSGPFALSLSGLRRGEVLGARWTDVTLDGQQPAIVVRRSRVQLGHGGGGISEGEPKSARSRRSVPLAPYALMALRRTRSLQAAHRLAAGAAYEDGDFVCCDELGRPPRHRR